MSVNKFLYLAEEEIHSILGKDYQIVIDSVEDALKMMYEGTTIQPDKSSQYLMKSYTK